MRKSRRLRAMVVGLLLGLVSTVALTGTAHAATTTLKLCNYSTNYGVRALFPTNAMLSAISPVVPNNSTCATFSVTTGQQYYLRYTENGTGRYALSATFSARGTTTLVQTWGTFAQRQPVFFQY